MKPSETQWIIQIIWQHGWLTAWLTLTLTDQPLVSHTIHTAIQDRWEVQGKMARDEVKMVSLWFERLPPCTINFSAFQRCVMSGALLCAMLSSHGRLKARLTHSIFNLYCGLTCWYDGILYLMLNQLWDSLKMILIKTRTRFEIWQR